MDFTSVVQELVEELVKEVSELTNETVNESDLEASSSSRDSERGDCQSDVPSQEKSPSFKQMRRGMGFLLSQLRKNDAQVTKMKAVAKRLADDQLLEKELAAEHDVEETYRKRKKLCVDFNLTTGHEVFREEGAFRTGALKFGFSLDSFCNNYVKCCKWNFDGTLLATSSQDRKLRLFTLKSDNPPSLNLVQTIPLSNLIYDVCWNPLSNLLASSSKEQPIHCWTSQGTRAISFRGINEQDELDSAHSLCFSSDGTQLYAGYKKVIRIFDMNRPGRHQREIKTWTKEGGGQKSIISCISMNPVMGGVYAAGSYGKSVAFYSDLSFSPECVFDASINGITHLRYSNDGNILFTAGRKEDYISCWDLRSPGKLLASLERPCRTNQRIYFEMESCNRYLFSGSSSGMIFVFDISLIGSSLQDPKCVAVPAHRSTLAGVSIHPDIPLVATCSGQRVYPTPDLDDLETNDEPCGYESSRRIEDLDNSLALWSFT